MIESIIHPLSKEIWQKLSFYINIILFFIVALFLYLLVIDCLNYNSSENSYGWLSIVRDIAFISVSLAFIFIQFFRNLLIIKRRSLQNQNNWRKAWNRPGRQAFPVTRNRRHAGVETKKRCNEHLLIHLLTMRPCPLGSEVMTTYGRRVICTSQLRILGEARK